MAATSHGSKTITAKASGPKGFSVKTKLWLLPKMATNVITSYVVAGLTVLTIVLALTTDLKVAEAFWFLVFCQIGLRIYFMFLVRLVKTVNVYDLPANTDTVTWQFYNVLVKWYMRENDAEAVVTATVGPDQVSSAGITARDENGDKVAETLMECAARTFTFKIPAMEVEALKELEQSTDPVDIRVETKKSGKILGVSINGDAVTVQV